MPAPDIRFTMELRGTPVSIRTITPEDREIESAFVRGLSDQSRYYRFHSALRELTPAMLERFTHIHYPDCMALIATIEEEERERQIAVARYVALPGGQGAELAVVVADDWQGQGLGTTMLRELRRIATEAGFRELHMNVLAENRRMLQLARKLGFRVDALERDSSRHLGKFIGPEPSS